MLEALDLLCYHRQYAGSPLQDSSGNQLKGKKILYLSFVQEVLLNNILLLLLPWFQEVLSFLFLRLGAIGVGIGKEW